MNTKTTNTIDFVNVEKSPIAILFRYDVGDKFRYVAVLSEALKKEINKTEAYTVAELFGKRMLEFDCQTVTDFYFGYSVSEDKFFRVCSADCAFPSFFVCDADHVGDAIDTFATECERWVKIEEPDLTAYDVENVSINDNGTPVDLEQVHVKALELVSLLYSK